MTTVSVSNAADKLPCWADISSLSDEELVKLYNSCQDELPRGYMLKLASVRRIASDVVMKANGGLIKNEVSTMAMALNSTSILIPRIRRTVNLGNFEGFVMDYILGQRVSDCWDRLSLWRRFRLFWTLRGYIRQLQCVVVTRKAQKDQFPGPIASEPQVCAGFMFTEFGAGPFSSYDELSAWYQHKLEVNRHVKGTPREDVSFDSSLPLVLTHLDISPNNVMIDEKSRIWLIDWDMAGLYPQWFEYLGMRIGWGFLGRWQQWILGFTAGFFERQAMTQQGDFKFADAILKVERGVDINGLLKAANACPDPVCAPRPIGVKVVTVHVVGGEFTRSVVVQPVVSPRFTAFFGICRSGARTRPVPKSRESNKTLVVQQLHVVPVPMSLSSIFSAVFGGDIHADAPEEKPEETPAEQPEEKEEEEEEEEEEPEDIHPALREECQESAKCKPLAEHFLHCQEKVQAGEGFKGEDCVEELRLMQVMMHCADNCVAPKLFSKLR
ncbi:hypothetical protein EVG20_g7346 [Dentipellis fragilis]|uniref:Ubiquinol-cytochrome C reductase hinge domain-containing protein n=1 Tax=Dentipellis fragilis TaxID=205917 RepID=A0A4Y9YDP3_9AGAM|nr:hypothetical protein EVG20_g7346 [Dentipellis fragilis]